MPRIRPVHFRRLCRVFELAGFSLTREEGGHLVYTRTGVKRPVIIPKYKEVPVFIILNNLRAAGLSRDDYFRLLNKA